jgi:hypothetical protein
MACSGLLYERHPLPDAAAWRGIADPRERLTTGLRAVYDWYEENAGLMACVMRDRERHALTREIGDLRVAPFAKAWREVLGAELSAKQRAMLHLALSFPTWRSLAPESGLTQADAVKAMVRAIETAES